MCKDIQHNGRHAILEYYDKYNHHWIVHLCGDSLKKVKPEHIQPITDDTFPFKDLYCDPQWDLIDELDEFNCTNNNNEYIYHRDTILGTNAASIAYNILPRKITQRCHPYFHPMCCSIFQDHVSPDANIALKEHGLKSVSFRV